MFQAEDGIRDLVRSRGLGDVYKRQGKPCARLERPDDGAGIRGLWCVEHGEPQRVRHGTCLLYTSDAADERSSVDLGGRRIIKKKKYERDRGVTRYSNRNNTEHVAETHVSLSNK